MRNLKEINWKYDYDLPELDREENYWNDERHVLINYRGKELLADLDIYLEYCSCYEADTNYKWVEFSRVDIGIRSITDLDEIDFYLSKEAIREIETELANDLKAQL